MASWASKRQPVTGISSTKHEFYSVSLRGLDYAYLRCMMEIMGYTQIGAISNVQDKNACMFPAKGSGMYNWARHIDNRVYRIRELATSATLKVKLFQDCMRGSAVRPLHRGRAEAGMKYKAVLMGEVPLTQNKNT